MYGDKSASDLRGILHHAPALAAGALSKNFGVTGKVMSGGVQGFFVDRPGSDGIDYSGQSCVDGGLNVVEGGLSRMSGDLAHLQEFWGDILQIDNDRTRPIRSLSCIPSG
jgi:hypothetical protein